MFNRLFIAFLFLTLFSCSTARMAMDPQLDNGYQKITIEEKPGVFSGDRLKFGPYDATGVDHDWTRGSGFSLGDTFKSQDSKQKYRYQFKGKDSWKVECLRKGKSKQIKIVKFDMEEGLLCEFVSDNGKTKFMLTMKGHRWVSAKGQFSIGTEEAKVVTISKLEGTSFSAGIPTGYHFLHKDKLVAAVDLISKDGPVWMSNTLDPQKKERLSLVIAALLLNKQQQ